MNNGQLAFDFVTKRFANLPALLVRDVQILPKQVDAARSRSDQACSQSLNEEAFDLLANLMSLKELQ